MIVVLFIDVDVDADKDDMEIYISSSTISNYHFVQSYLF